MISKFVDKSRVVGLVILSIFLLVPWNIADAVNRTIDDTFGDSTTKQKVLYSPMDNTWNDATCLLSSGCAIVGNPSQYFSNTYTAATYKYPSEETSITIQFNGTAIYVFLILANNVGDGTIARTIANFTLDGGRPQLFTHQPDLNTTELNYGALVYSQKNLMNTEHTLVISASGIEGGSYINFDYAIYTHHEYVNIQSSTLTKHKEGPLVGTIVGGFMGGIVILLTLTALVVLLARRQRNSNRRVKTVVDTLPPLLMDEINPASLSQSPPRPTGSIDPFMDSQLFWNKPSLYFAPQSSREIHLFQALKSAINEEGSLHRLR